jgi:hypothetical protein
MKKDEIDLGTEKGEDKAADPALKTKRRHATPSAINDRRHVHAVAALGRAGSAIA